ncbi:MAG TPA: DUF5110 domain-containing protein, partial [Gemmatimonadaceae bacterium]|nr:DUF5110 domain-containing protein [Gemmatimonadaceae bacterium]
TGGSHTSPQEIDVLSPIDTIPLHVPAGTILPLGPDMEWSTQNAADPIEIRVYEGKTGDFTLYEDENDSYNYEKGMYATIPLHWDDSQHTLIIGARRGSFPGMLQSRTFRVIFVAEKHGAGIDPTERADRVVTYEGNELKVTK